MNALGLVLGLLLAATLLPLPAQTFELRSGEVVIGHVVDLGDQSLRLRCCAKARLSSCWPGSVGDMEPQQ